MSEDVSERAVAETEVRAARVILERDRFEILPFGRGEEEASKLAEPARITVTCSPKHGPDLSVEVGARLRGFGHPVTVHIAARMVRDRSHVDALLDAIASADIDDIFLVGGDHPEPLGPYSSGADLIPVIHEHPKRPRALGIPGYPEGHPLIDDGALDQALRDKSRVADYIVTQMCFNADALTGWIKVKRDEGITLPVLIGIPGKVNPKRLLELSVRVGVGPSLSYLRKQHGVQHLLGRSVGDKLFDKLAPAVGAPILGIAGFHFFTFNQLLDTWQLQQRRAGVAA